MGNRLRKEIDPDRFDNNTSYDDFSPKNEQYDTWFLGSLMRDNVSPANVYNRLSKIHNGITHDETNFDECMLRNRHIASILSEFFPLKWLLETTSVIRKVGPTKLSIKTFKDRVCFYLGFIELYLTFRGLTLLDSTLDEINESFAVDITKNQIRTWKIKLLRIIPELREQWIKIRSQTHQSVIFSTVVQVMNRELVLTGCSKEEIFQIKHECLRITREFIATPKANHIKKPEVWARAICLKAFREILPEKTLFPFLHLPANTQKVIETKKWKIGRALTEKNAVI